MGLAEELFPQRQGRLVERFGLAVAPLRFVQAREIVEAGGDIGMGLAEELFQQRQGLLVERFGLAVAPLRFV